MAGMPKRRAKRAEAARMAAMAELAKLEAVEEDKANGPPPAPRVMGVIIPPEKEVSLVSLLVGPDGTISKHEAFSKLLDLSIERAVDIMSMKGDPNTKEGAKIISTQQAVAASVFSTAARIDETQLRRQQTDKMKDILERIRAEEATQAQMGSPSALPGWAPGSPLRQ